MTFRHLCSTSVKQHSETSYKNIKKTKQNHISVSKKKFYCGTRMEHRFPGEKCNRVTKKNFF